VIDGAVVAYLPRLFYGVACWTSRDRDRLLASGVVLVVGTALDAAAYRWGKGQLSLETYVLLRAFAKAHLIVFLVALLPWRSARPVVALGAFTTGGWVLTALARGTTGEALFVGVQVVDDQVRLVCTAGIFLAWLWGASRWVAQGHFMLRRSELILALFLLSDLLQVSFGLLTLDPENWYRLRATFDAGAFTAAGILAMVKLPPEDWWPAPA
jgi:hypothetical protein